MKYQNTRLDRKAYKMQLTINNPQKENTTPQGKGLNTVEDVKNYIDTTKKLTDGDYYCLSFEIGLKEATPHIHIFFSFKNQRYGNTFKKLFPTAHIEYCGGSNQENRDYIYKTGKWEGNEKEDTRIEGMQYENRELPEEKGQGSRTDLEYMKELIDKGMTPTQILELEPNFYSREAILKKMFFDKRKKETPIKRHVEVIIHTGIAGSGKSHVMTTIPEDTICIVTDYSTGLFDMYEGQEHLFMDEFRGQIPYNQLLTVLDGYKVPVHARFTNVLSLWNTVHITSVIPFEEWYQNDNIRDTFEQLKRRISKITYHYITHNGILITNIDKFFAKYSKSEIQYHEYTIDAARYTSYEDLEKEALAAAGIIARYNDDLTVSVNLDLKRPEWLVKRDNERHAYWNRKKDIMNNDPFGLMVDEYKELLPFELTLENDIFHMLEA